MTTEDVTRCGTCGLPDWLDASDPHVCPPAFQEVQMPTDLNVSSAAGWVVTLHGDPLLRGSYRGALDGWSILTGAPDDETALRWAREVVERPGSVTATIPPF